MAILKKHKQIIINDHVDEQTGHYITVKKWISRIYRVEDIDKPDPKTNYWTIDSDCKLVYAYLFNFGKCHGWNSIYPNQDLIVEELGIPLRTVQRKIKTLGESGLIDVIKTKDKSLYWSNRYRVNRPSNIGRRKWFDVNGVELIGKLYKFDFNTFKKKVG